MAAAQSQEQRGFCTQHCYNTQWRNVCHDSCPEARHYCTTGLCPKVGSCASQGPTRERNGNTVAEGILFSAPCWEVSLGKSRMEMMCWRRTVETPGRRFKRANASRSTNQIEGPRGRAGRGGISRFFPHLSLLLQCPIGKLLPEPSWVRRKEPQPARAGLGVTQSRARQGMIVEYMGTGLAQAFLNKAEGFAGKQS